jgi:hypothetical protein
MLAPKQPQMYCYDDAAKKRNSLAMRRFYRAAAKQLPEFTFKVHFNAGGIAVWGETYAKIYRDGKPVVEAYDTSMGVLIRQWDGRNSGHNHYTYQLDSFVFFVRELAAKPFVRF